MEEEQKLRRRPVESPGTHPPSVSAATRRAANELVLIVGAAVVLAVTAHVVDRHEALLGTLSGYLFPELDEMLLTAAFFAAASAVFAWRRWRETRKETLARAAADAAARRYAERLEVLGELSRAMLGQQSPASIAEVALQRLRRLVACARASVVLLDWQSGEAEFLAVDPPADGVLGRGERVPLNEFMGLEALRRGELVKVDDPGRRGSQRSWSEALRSVGVSAYVKVPMLCDGKLLGSLNLGCDEQGLPTDPVALEAAREVADILAVSLQQASWVAELRRSESRYRSLFEGSPVSLWEEDFSALKARLDEMAADGLDDVGAYLGEHPEELANLVPLARVLAVNPATVAVYGARSSAELLGSLGTIAGEGMWQVHRDSIVAVSAGRRSYHGEAMNRALDGTPLHVMVGWQVLPGHEETYSRVLVSVVDISEQKRTTQRLREQRERLEVLYGLSRNLGESLRSRETARRALAALREVVGGSSGSLLLADGRGGLEVAAAVGAGEEALGAVRERWAKVPGFGLAGWVAANALPALVGDVRRDSRWSMVPRVSEGVRSALGVPLVNGPELIGVLLLTSERENAFTEDHLQLVEAAAGQVAVSLANDRLFETLSRQREELRALGVRLEAAREDERRRLARELHDRVGQGLTALSMNLQIAIAPETAREAANARLDEALGLVRDTQRWTRDVMAELRPPLLDDHGLDAALRLHAEQVARRTGLSVVVQGGGGESRLRAEEVIVLFRIAQEALTNVVKHSGAANAMVVLEERGDVFRMIVADDGRGFDPEAVGEGREGGWGLVGMRERAEAIGGTLRVVSEADAGTQVVVEVRLAADNPHQAS